MARAGVRLPGQLARVRSPCPAQGAPRPIPGKRIADLAGRHTVVLADLPGSGAAGGPRPHCGSGALADRGATAQEAGLRDFVIAGTSLGTVVAAKVAARHPDPVRGLFTLAGFADGIDLLIAVVRHHFRSATTAECPHFDAAAAT
nr:alpha/beta fold hydrolase [Streptomyces carpinensis]